MGSLGNQVAEEAIKMARRRISAVAAASVALFIAPWPHSVAAAHTVAGRPAPMASIARSSSAGHLYVLDFMIGHHAIYRFALAPDGLPATQPDSALYPQGAIYPQGIAVDKSGHIFMADPLAYTCYAYGVCLQGGAVAEFAAGATGPQWPISLLYADLPGIVKMDDAQRLYVHIDGRHEIGIFAKGAHGQDPPISVVSDHALVTDYTIAKSGVLYASNFDGPVGVYDNPLNSPSQPDRLINQDGNFYSFRGTLALDEATNRLYIQFDVQLEKYWNKVNYDVRSPSGVPAATAKGPWIFTGDCGPLGLTSVGGAVIIKKYLIVSCASIGVVFVYRTGQFGRQSPVELVGQGLFNGPETMAVGP
jgi:hypothetical protein